MLNNIVPDINIGYPITNIKKIINSVASVLDITVPVYVVPMKVKLDNVAYVVDQEGLHTLFIEKSILEKDKVSDFNIKMLIHELTHIKQRLNGDLISKGNDTVVTWKGRSYDNNYPYNDRPWEIEAQQNETRLLKQVKQLL